MPSLPGPRLLARLALALLAPAALGIPAAWFYATYRMEVLDASLDRTAALLERDIGAFHLQAQAQGFAAHLDSYLRERVIDVQRWASTPFVLDRVSEAAELHAEAGLPALSSVEAEDRFRIERRARARPTFDEYLYRELSISGAFARAIVTDRYAMNVAFTERPERFVHAASRWWRGAWERGIYLGPVYYDDAHGRWALPVAVRLDTIAGGVPVGVLYADLTLEPVQGLASRYARAVPGTRIFVLDASGALIADTASAHARERMMTVIPPSSLGLEAEIPPIPEGEDIVHVVGSEWVSALVPLARAGAFDNVFPGFPGFAWLALFQLPSQEVNAAGASLRILAEMLRDARFVLLAALGVLALVTALAVLAAMAPVVLRRGQAAERP